jgi:hypothetical protein
LNVLIGWPGPASAIRVAEGWQQPGKLWPGGTSKLTQPVSAEIGEQGAQRLHDRAIRQGAAADRHAAAAKHADVVIGAAAFQLGDQARLTHPSLAPQQDHGRFGVGGPHPGGLKGSQFLDAADEGGARHAAAHLGGIITSARPEESGAGSGRDSQTY